MIIFAPASPMGLSSRFKYFIAKFSTTPTHIDKQAVLVKLFPATSSVFRVRFSIIASPNASPAAEPIPLQLRSKCVRVLLNATALVSFTALFKRMEFQDTFSTSNLHEAELINSANEAPPVLIDASPILALSAVPRRLLDRSSSSSFSLLQRHCTKRSASPSSTSALCIVSLVSGHLGSDKYSASASEESPSILLRDKSRSCKDLMLMMAWMRCFRLTSVRLLSAKLIASR
mmetsp:Transcript_40945/g.70867  ORF Transcript_40945/g.70867 Transcript_40945/m.70867 type:complete len:231 (-) Transcript_40945:1926-2618(-)